MRPHRSQAVFDTAEIQAGVGQLRFVLRLLGADLIELRLISGRIGARENIAALHLLPFTELDREKPSIGLRPNRRGIERLDGADRIKRHGHIGITRRSRQNRNRPLAAEPSDCGRLAVTKTSVPQARWREQSVELVTAQPKPLGKLTDGIRVPQRRPD